MDSVTALVFLGVSFFNLVISTWNAYASGFNGELLKIMEKSRLRSFLRFSYLIGVLFSLIGAIYATALIIGSLLFLLDLVSVWIFEVLNDICFLVFGGLIVVFGIVITVHGYVVTYYRRKMGKGKRSDWLINGWNTYAMVRNTIVYLRYFGDALRDLSSLFKGSSRRRDRDRGYVILAIIFIVAIIIASYIIYKAYSMGQRRARMLIRDTLGEEYLYQVRGEGVEVPQVVVVRRSQRL